MSSWKLFRTLRSKTTMKTSIVAGAFLGTYSWLSNNSSQFKSQETLTKKEVCGTADLQDGQMREFQVGPNKRTDKILVAKIDGQFYAVGSRCTHFGAPLSQGLLIGDKVYCPWHLASFSVKTGFHQYGPVFNSLKTFNVIVKDDRVFVEVP